MLLIKNLLQPVEVTAEPRPKTDLEGAQKFSPEGLAGWVVPVEMITGEREKKLPTGDVVKIVDTKRLRVTVWGAVVGVKIGDYVRFSGLQIGCFDSNFYFHATGIEIVGA